MAEGSRNLEVYEVRCDHCDVSFPPGTKRCIHCGERIGRPRLLPGAGESMPSFEGGEPFPEAHDADEAEGQSSGRFLRIGFTLVWLLLAFASAAVRACQEK
jgi:hypothetical protein